MPKRVIDGEAVWGSDKLTSLPPSAQREYPWLYPLADCNGNFELTNLRAVWGRVYASRPDITTEDMASIIGAYNEVGLLFIWQENGKRYGHWTNSDRAGRLPRESHRSSQFERVIASTIPLPEYQEYVSRFAKPIIPEKLLQRQQNHKQTHRGNRRMTTASSVRSQPPLPSQALALALVKDKNTPGEGQEVEIGDGGGIADHTKRIWEFYLQRLGKNPKILTFTILRKRKGTARFQECLKKTDGDPVKAEAMMRACVEALASSKFHMGENDSGKRYDSWEKHLFPSQEKLEWWLEKTTLPPTSRLALPVFDGSYARTMVEKAKKDEIVSGYQVTQPVDLGNLRIPSNLATAAVAPDSSGQPAPALTETAENRESNE